jgi:hypothetical protein
VHGALDTEQRDLVLAVAGKPAAALGQLLFAEYVGPQRVVADGADRALRERRYWKSTYRCPPGSA